MRAAAAWVLDAVPKGRCDIRIDGETVILCMAVKSPEEVGCEASCVQARGYAAVFKAFGGADMIRSC